MWDITSACPFLHSNMTLKLEWWVQPLLTSQDYFSACTQTVSCSVSCAVSACISLCPWPYGPILQFLCYLTVTMSHSSGLMDLQKFVFCFLIDVRINSKMYSNMSELILKYLQNLCSSLSKSSRTLWNLPKLSRLELILCNHKRLFLVNKTLLHQKLFINEYTCTWFDILAVQKCQLHCFQLGSARLFNVNSYLLGPVQLGSAQLVVWMRPYPSLCRGWRSWSRLLWRTVSSVWWDWLGNNN
jgi:hypothetical protein